MDKHAPFFSIIIPTLNEEEYLPRLLECIAKQTFKDFEVIVVDGHSTDQTKEKALGFRTKIPQLEVLDSEKQNVSHQRNVGAAQAKAEYVIFFDADIQIPRHFLQKLASVIRVHRFMFVAVYQRPDSSEPRDWILVTIANIAMEISNLLDKPWVGGFDIIMHKSVFQQIGGFNEKLKLAEDHDLAQRALSIGVRMKLLHSPRLVVSLRRFRHTGYFTLVKRYTQSQLYYVLRGPIKKALFDYPMGGHIYKNEKKVSVASAVRVERWLLKTVRQIIGV